MVVNTRTIASKAMTKFVVGCVTAVTALLMLSEQGIAADKCVRILGPEWGSEKMTPDPARMQTTADFNHARAIYEPLVDQDANLEPIPVLAESWESNKEGTVWTFHLRKGVKF